MGRVGHHRAPAGRLLVPSPFGPPIFGGPKFFQRHGHPTPRRSEQTLRSRPFRAAPCAALHSPPALSLPDAHSECRPRGWSRPNPDSFLTGSVASGSPPRRSSERHSPRTAPDRPPPLPPVAPTSGPPSRAPVGFRRDGPSRDSCLTRSARPAGWWPSASYGMINMPELRTSEAPGFTTPRGRPIRLPRPDECGQGSRPWTPSSPGPPPCPQLKARNVFGAPAS